MSDPYFVAPAVGAFYQGTASDYGPRMHPVTGVPSFHRGIDISAPVGTPIRSAFSGTVRDVRTDSYNGDPSGNRITGTWNTGNFVLVDRPSGDSEWYGHLDTVSVVRGQTVRAGDRVGTMGRTGTVTGPHLHFESWIGRNQGGGSGAGNTRDPKAIYNEYGITPGRDGSGGSEGTWFDMATEAQLREIVTTAAENVHRSIRRDLPSDLWSYMGANADRDAYAYLRGAFSGVQGAAAQGERVGVLEAMRQVSGGQAIDLDAISAAAAKGAADALGAIQGDPS